jgi:diaminopimelate epimerase
MRFSKWQALGNTYLVVERAEGPLDAPSVRELSSETDGVVEVLSVTDDELDVAIWNPDGSRAELSGNGTRIAARWLSEATGAQTILVRIGRREVVARILPSGDVEQEMGEVEVGDAERVAEVELVPVSVGNPHAVVRGDPADVGRIGPLLETHPSFPNRTNVEVVRVERPGEVTARVWERGVGETASSGTGAVAAAAATHGEGEVVVHFPGGDLHVRLERGRAWLTGTAERVE